MSNLARFVYGGTLSFCAKAMADVDRKMDVDKSALKDKVRGWFAAGRTNGSTHMVIIYDSFTKTHEPRYANNLGNAQLVAHRVHAQCDTRVVAVYNLSLDLESQLAEHHPYHLD